VSIRSLAQQIEVFDRAIDIQITRIRKKIGDDPKSPHIIHTVRRAGYMPAVVSISEDLPARHRGIEGVEYHPVQWRQKDGEV